MSPIKTHLLDRLRPKDRTMTTMTDEEAFALGVRAISAGMERKRGMVTTHAEPQWRNGVIVDFDYDGPHISVPSGVEEYVPPVIVPDLRDPFTKDHAVAQLRERMGDPGIAFTMGWDNERDCAKWETAWIEADATTEEEAIVAAFEATKETP